jgi:hypothetical protein
MADELTSELWRERQVGFKYYLIQPMAGRSEEEILKERQMWKTVLKDFGEVLGTYFTEEAPKNCNTGLYYLGKSIQAMSEADFVICLPHWRKYRGCRIEYKCAKAYGKKILKIKLTKG